MEDKYLKRISEELTKLNRNIEQLVLCVKQTREQTLIEETPFEPFIGSEGSPKQSEK